jgi:hypothetical protein
MDWKHALDLQHDCCNYYRSDDGIDAGSAFLMGLFRNYTPPLETMRKIYMDMVSCLYQADTIYVTSDMIHLAMQAAHDMPDTTQFNMKSLLSIRGFVLLEEKIIGKDKSGLDYAVHAFAWERELILNPYNRDGGYAPGVGLYFFTDPYDDDDSANEELREILKEQDYPIPPLVLSHYFPLVEGYRPTRENDHIPGHAIVTELLRLFMSLMYLSHQTIGEPIKLRPDRATRRRAQREWNMNDPLITVITLRRKSVKPDNHEPGKVEWSRRWLVKGFWRNQWYPSLGIHQPVYIHEYIKGPEDKPFIPPSGRVFNFRR